MRRSSPGLLTFVLLGAALVLSGVLAYAAVDATRKHRATAQAVLGDYVTFASEQFAQRFTQEVEYYRLYPTMQLLAGIQGDLPEPADLIPTADERLKQSLVLAKSFFRFSPPEIRVVSSPNATLPSNFSRVLAHQVQQTTSENALYGFVVTDESGADAARVFVFATGTSVAPDVHGFEANLPMLREVSREIFERTQLLPASVTGDLENDAIFSIAFVRTTGDTLWTLPDAATPISPEIAARGVYPLGAKWPQMELHTAFRDGVTNELIAGGVPGSRVPLTVTLAIATAALLIATVIQVLRERSLAKLRAEFVSSVSHELRTPLAQIRMFAETLRLGRMESTADRDRSLAVIDKEARRLTHLVENVLLFSKPRIKMTTGELTYTKLDELLQEVAEGYRPLADARSVSIRLQTTPLAAPVDVPAVRQSVLNLLDNAIKYGPEGQEVLLSLETAGTDALIAVEDQGPGVPPDRRLAIWKRFARLERERRSVTTGAGIGLAVVHELISAQGGKCWVEDGTVGARFVLTLPNARSRHASISDNAKEVGDQPNPVSRR